MLKSQCQLEVKSCTCLGSLSDLVSVGGVWRTGVSLSLSTAGAAGVSWVLASCQALGLCIRAAHHRNYTGVLRYPGSSGCVSCFVDIHHHALV